MLLREFAGRKPQPTAMVIDSRTGLGKPASRTGGEIRDASGTSPVSRAVPVPTDGPDSGTPGIYRGATTSGNRNVTSPSEYGKIPTRVISTDATSPGIRLPTRRLKTPGRSSSAIDARWP